MQLTTTAHMTHYNCARGISCAHGHGFLRPVTKSMKLQNKLHSIRGGLSLSLSVPLGRRVVKGGGDKPFPAEIIALCEGLSRGQSRGRRSTDQWRRCDQLPAGLVVVSYANRKERKDIFISACLWVRLLFYFNVIGTGCPSF